MTDGRFGEQEVAASTSTQEITTDTVEPANVDRESSLVDEMLSVEMRHKAVDTRRSY
jgi:hypothetical protein